MLVNSGFSISMLFSIGYAGKNFFNPYFRWAWSLKDSGYEWHVANSIFEWLFLLSLVPFIYTFVYDFQRLTFEKMKLDFNFSADLLTAEELRSCGHYPFLYLNTLGYIRPESMRPWTLEDQKYFCNAEGIKFPEGNEIIIRLFIINHTNYLLDIANDSTSTTPTGRDFIGSDTGEEPSTSTSGTLTSTPLQSQQEQRPLPPVVTNLKKQHQYPGSSVAVVDNPPFSSDISPIQPTIKISKIVGSGTEEENILFNQPLLPPSINDINTIEYDGAVRIIDKSKVIFKKGNI